jgi:TonB family protein
VQTDGTDEPVFGVSMDSTSQQGGPTVAVGNTLTPGTPSAPAKPAGKPAAPPPVAAYEATKLPLPQGRCFGTYTDEAKAAGIEGTVVLDLTVDESGHARDVTVVKGLEHGLSAAALAAMKGCQFTPGEKDGKPVAVRIKGFKITFVLQDAR